MPAYSATGNAVTSIAPGDSFQAWLAVGEAVTAGSGLAAASQQCAPMNAPGVGGNGYVFKIQFSAAPGAFEVDCQESDVDSDTSYQTIPGGMIDVVDPNNFTAEFLAPYSGAKFLRMLQRSLTNSVKISGTIRQR